MFQRCFEKNIDLDVFDDVWKKPKHRINDASNDVNRPPLLASGNCDLLGTAPFVRTCWIWYCSYFIVNYVATWHLRYCTCSFNTLASVAYLAPLLSYVIVDIVPVCIVRVDIVPVDIVRVQRMRIATWHLRYCTCWFNTLLAIVIYLAPLLPFVPTCWTYLLVFYMLYVPVDIVRVDWESRLGTFDPSARLLQFDVAVNECCFFSSDECKRRAQSVNLLSDLLASETLLMGLKGSWAIKRGTNEHECEPRVHESSSNPEASIQIEMHLIEEAFLPIYITHCFKEYSIHKLESQSHGFFWYINSIIWEIYFAR